MATLEPLSTARPHDNRSAPWIEWLAVGAILLLAGGLRMAAPGLTEFKADEARLLALAYDMAEGQLALRGISSSTGFPNFPASVWLYALPAAVWAHPYAATVFTGLLSTLAVALSYWFVHRYWGVTAALAATLMYTVSPWAIIFSRKIWAQNLLPLFVLGWVIGAALALVEQRPRFLWLHFLCLALAVQIHLAAVALIPATLVLLILFRHAVRWRDVVIGCALAALTALPFAVYLGQSQDIASVLSASGGTNSGGISLASLQNIVTISLGRQVHSLAGAAALEEYLALVPDLTAVHLLWGLLMITGLFIFVRQWRLQPVAASTRAGVIVLVWLIMPALVFLWQWTPVFLHYFISVLPAPYIAAGVAFAQLARMAGALPERSRRLVLLAAWTLLILTAVAQVATWLTLQNFITTTATPGGFGVPLAMKLEAVEQAQSLMEQTGAGEVLIAGRGEQPRLDDFPAEWDVLLRHVPHRFVDATQSALFPAAASVVLLDGRLASPPSTGDLYARAAAAQSSIPLREGEGTYEIMALPGDARPQQEVPLEPPILLANWVNLLGYDLPQRFDSETAIWQVHYRTGDNPDPSDYQFFNHLLDNQGQRIGQLDAAAFDPGQWQAGDTVIGRFMIPWSETAEGPFTMRVGMYRYPSLESVPLMDEAGNPYQDAAEFPLEVAR